MGYLPKKQLAEAMVRECVVTVVSIIWFTFTSLYRIKVLINVVYIETLDINLLNYLLDAVRDRTVANSYGLFLLPS